MWLTLLALAVSPTAFAHNSDGSERAGANPAPVTMNVSTSLDSCGLADTEIVCKLDVSYSSVPGASSYTATVTAADGSVIDYGSVGVGSTSVFVPYTGPGSYSVRITAYGTPPQPGGRGNVIATGTDHPVKADVSGARGNNSAGKRRPGSRISGHATQASPTHSPGNAGVQAGAQAQAQPQTQDPGSTAEPPPPEQAPPACVATPEQPNPLPPDDDPKNDDEDGDGISDAQELAAAAAGTPLTIPGTGVDCPAQ
ncbi:MAG: hypothetical protein ACJ75R_03935 [Solirubrobacterales bacterium]